MVDQIEMADAHHAGHSNLTPLTPPIVADSAAASKAFRTAQARAAMAGHQLHQTASGFMLTRWSHSRHCADLATVDVLLVRMGSPK
jgi:hypothetical protein